MTNSIAYFKRSTGNVNKKDVSGYKRALMRTEMGDWITTHPSHYIINKIDYEDNVLNANLDVVIEDDSSLNKVTGMKMLYSLNREFDKGDYLRYNNESWLVVRENSDNQVFSKYEIRHCNFNLSFINDVGKSIDMPCVLESRNPYSPGISEDSRMQLGDNQRSISIQTNTETLKFERDDEFVIGGLTYRIASYDREVEPRVSFFVLTEYQEGEDVNITYTVSILESDLSLSATDTAQLNVVARADNAEINRPLVYTSSDTSVATVSENGLVTAVANGSATITVAFRDNSNISDTVSVSVVDTPVDNIEYRFNIDSPTVVREFEEKTYTFNKYNNDVIDPTNFTFDIDYNGNNNRIAILNTIDGNNVRLTANRERIYGTIFLVANEGVDERGRLEIRIRSIF